MAWVAGLGLAADDAAEDQGVHPSHQPLPLRRVLVGLACGEEGRASQHLAETRKQSKKTRLDIFERYIEGYTTLF